MAANAVFYHLLRMGSEIATIWEPFCEAMMSIKPDANTLKIKEQIIVDPVTGLVFQFVVVPGSSALYRLRVFGDLPHRNREFLFDKDGAEAGAGAALSGPCRPSWLQEVAPKGITSLQRGS